MIQNTFRRWAGAVRWRQMLYERQQKGVKPDAIYHHALAAIHLKNGNAEAAEHHLTKAKDLEK